MTDLTKLEEEVLDVIGAHQGLSSWELEYQMKWGTAKLMPILAALTEKKAIKTQKSETYPYPTYYFLVK